jgi:glyoxylase-like metal-dependent hydrolase (beta-lactamase superfamily II)
MGLLEYSNSIVDSGVVSGPMNRITNELTVLGDNLAVIESFSHVWSVRTGEGLVLFDASGAPTGSKVVETLRTWSSDPVHTIVYTHGHADHTGGAGAFVADAEARGHPRPRFVGHENVAPRFARYRKTNGYNVAINRRQFSPGRTPGFGIGDVERFLPDATPDPDVEFRDHLELVVGDERFVLRHDKGETDDHAWTEWVGHGSLFVGDFLIWNFPNCGNPQKVLRYPAEWAAALRKMMATAPTLVGPAHGLPLDGAARADRVLGTTAEALESLVAQVVDLLNADASLADALHTVAVPPSLAELPWLRPMYDEPEFVVRNIWRTYGGWWDGNPAHLHPPRPAVLEAGDLRTACELIELAAQAVPDNPATHEARCELYARRRQAATSLMAKGIYEGAARQSAAIAGVDVPDMQRRGTALS